MSKSKGSKRAGCGSTPCEETASAAKKKAKVDPDQAISATPNDASTSNPSSTSASSNPSSTSAEVLEKGLIYWFYRPKVEKTEAHHFDDVQRLYMLLSPSTPNSKKRLLVITSKAMPKVRHGAHERHWAFVDMVHDELKAIHHVLDKTEYDTKTKGHRVVQPSRPLGEGLYEIVRHSGHHGVITTSLSYVLEVPSSPGPVQKAMNIEKEACYVLQVKNPFHQTEGAPGLQSSAKSHFPKELQEKFKGVRVAQRKWVPVDPPHFLDIPHCEVLMIGEASNLVDEFGAVGKELEEMEKEDEAASLKRLQGHLEDKVFEELGLEKKDHPDAPLKGQWA